MKTNARLTKLAPYIVSALAALAFLGVPFQNTHSTHTALSSEARIDSLYVFPNPARTGAQPILHLEVAGAERAVIEIFAPDGRLMQRDRIDAASATAGHVIEHPIPVADLAPGVYTALVNVHAHGDTAARRQVSFTVLR